MKQMTCTLFAAAMLTSPLSPLAGQQIAFDKVTVDPQPPNNPWVKVLGDFNLDGQIDIAVGGSRGPLVWYESPTWERHVVAAGGYATVDGEAADIDSDGDPDIALGGVVWYENPGRDQVTGGKAWKLHRVGNLRSHDIEVADLDGDGKLDMVTRDQSSFGNPAGNQIQIWKQERPDRWTRRNLDCPQGEGLKLGDVDLDGDPDIVIGARWYQNDGEILTKRWPEHIYTSKWTHPDATVSFGDLNGDGRGDIVLTPAELKGDSYRIAWYEAPSDVTGEWKEHIMEREQETVVHAVEVADFNGDRMLDVIVAEMHQGADPDEVRIYINQANAQSWFRQVISTMGSHDVAVADIGADGDTDIVGANHGGSHQALELWENRTIRLRKKRSSFRED